VNPIDFKLRSGAAAGRIPIELPAILGRDIAGQVIALAPNVTKVRVGDRVLGLGVRSYAEKATVRAEVLARVPDELDLMEAGALPLVLTTGGQLASHADPKPGQTLLVTGALGSVGRVAVFVAKERGAKVIAGVRKTQQQAADELGADHVVAIDDEAAIARLPELDSIADTVGGQTIAKLLSHLRSGGRLASVLGEPAAAKGRPIVVRAFVAQPDAELLGRLAQAVARKQLTIPIAERLPLAKASEAQARMEQGRVQGKILLLP
jgi:NADPH:quinone reductase-like Zn-dependent oxidoreductase